MGKNQLTKRSHSWLGRAIRNPAVGIPCCLAAAACIVALPQLFNPAFGVKADQSYHYHATRAFLRCLSDGEWFPRWAGLFDGGRGDALFTFYPPLYYLLTGILVSLFHIPILTALKWMSLITIFASEWAAYTLARAFFGRWASALSGIAYVLLPAYSLIALRFSLFPNALALAFVPLTFLGAHYLFAGVHKRRGLTLFAIAASCVVLTHVITAYLLVLAIVLMAPIHWLEVRWPGAVRLLGAGVLVLALTAFFWVPVFVETPWVQVEQELAQHHYSNYFLFAGPADSSPYRQTYADYNYVASLVTLAQTILTLTLAAACLRRTRGSALTPAIASISAVALVGLLVSLPVSDPVWRMTPGMRFAQFPWRLQPFVALGAAFLLGATLQDWKRYSVHKKLILAGVLFWMVTANLFLTLVLLRSHDPVIQRRDVASLLNSESAPAVTSQEFTRLLYAGSPDYLAYLSNRLPYRPRGAEQTLYPAVRKVGGLQLVSGQGRITPQQLENTHREFAVSNESTVTVRAETYAYPHWVLRCDGKQLEVTAEQGSGLILAQLPPGRHKVTLDYEVGVGWEKLANIISAVAWLLLLAWAVLPFGRKTAPVPGPALLRRKP